MERTLEAAIWRLYKSFGEPIVETPSVCLARILKEFCADIRDVPEDTIVRRLEKVTKDRVQLGKLRALPAVAQRSEEWFALRRERLTASDAFKALENNRTRDSLVRNKAFPETVRYSSSAPTEWGKMFEPMALRVYRARCAQVPVHEFGLIPHPTLHCFGASPDGITDLGVMIEIKCPYSREIKPNYIPEYYEVQMQGQMAVCGLTDCDYIECKMVEYKTMEEFVTKTKRAAHPEDFGIVIKVGGGGSGGGEEGYEYSPPLATANEVLEWAERICSEVNAEKIIMWSLNEIVVQRVKFDPVRWQSMVPKFEKFWEDVVAARKQPRDRVEFIDDD